ncbi:fungal-specific transcription factor domain-containing protein [Trichoderma evansii]
MALSGKGIMVRRNQLSQLKNGRVQKVPRACQRCRRQKLKCDVNRPCTLCERAGVDCSAMEADIWKPVRPNQIIGKVRKVDGDGSIHQTTKRASHPAQAVEEEAIIATATTVSSSARYEARNMSSVAKGVNPVASQSPWASSSAAMTFVEEAFDHQNTIAPEGRDVSALSATHWTRQGAPGSTWPKQGQARLKKLITAEDKLMMLLPDIRAATLLVDNYFDKIHWFVLVFHQREFRDQFQQLYASDHQESEECGSRLGHISVFLAVCTVSLQYTSFDQKQKLADVGIEQHVLQDEILDALRLRLLDIVSLGSLESIQTCVLLGTFYLYHGQPELAWPICGCGLRIAQALNLHRRSSSGSSTPDLDNPIQRAQESRKRCWWAIYEIETFCSMLYGFPLSISDRDCDTGPLHPYAVRSLDSLEDSIFRRAAGQPTLLSYKYFMVQLSIIVKSALADLYGLHRPSDESKKRGDKYSLKQLIERVTNLDIRLQKWSQSLPARLQFNEATKDPTSRLPISSDRYFEDHLFQLQALALKLAFENARILVYRPLLSYRRVVAAHGTSESFKRQERQAMDPFQTSIQICRNAAFQVSLLGSFPIFEQVADTYAVSFVSLHLFTAGVTLSILTGLGPLSRESHESKMGLRRLMEMQSRLRSKSIIAEQGLGILKTLMSLILEKEANKIFDFESHDVDDQTSLNPQNQLLNPQSPCQKDLPANDQFTTSPVVEISNDNLNNIFLPADSSSFIEDDNIFRFDICEDPSMIQALFNFEQGFETNTNASTDMERNDMESSLESSFGGQDPGWIWSIDSYK